MAKKKNTKSDITVVLPVHQLNGESEIKLFNNAVNSVIKQETQVDELGNINVPKLVPDARPQSSAQLTFDQQHQPFHHASFWRQSCLWFLRF